MPEFFRHYLTLWIRAREEGLEFGMNKLKQLCILKRNNGFPDTTLLSPRPRRTIVDGIPDSDDQWREKFSFFKVNTASVGDFDFDRVPESGLKMLVSPFFLRVLVRAFRVYLTLLNVSYRSFWECADDSPTSRISGSLAPR